MNARICWRGKDTDDLSQLKEYVSVASVWKVTRLECHQTTHWLSQEGTAGQDRLSYSNTCGSSQKILEWLTTAKGTSAVKCAE